MKSGDATTKTIKKKQESEQEYRVWHYRPGRELTDPLYRSQGHISVAHAIEASHRQPANTSFGEILDLTAEVFLHLFRGVVQIKKLDK